MPPPPRTRRAATAAAQERPAAEAELQERAWRSACEPLLAQVVGAAGRAREARERSQGAAQSRQLQALHAQCARQRDAERAELEHGSERWQAQLVALQSRD